MVLPNVKCWDVYCCANGSTLFPCKLCLGHYLNTGNKWEPTMVKSFMEKIE